MAMLNEEQELDKVIDHVIQKNNRRSILLMSRGDWIEVAKLYSESKDRGIADLKARLAKYENSAHSLY